MANLVSAGYDCRSLNHDCPSSSPTYKQTLSFKVTLVYINKEIEHSKFNSWLGPEFLTRVLVYCKCHSRAYYGHECYIVIPIIVLDWNSDILVYFCSCSVHISLS